MKTPTTIVRLYEIAPAKTGDPCAACGQGGDYRLKRSLQAVDGIRLMLCIDYRACNRRSGAVRR